MLCAWIILVVLSKYLLTETINCNYSYLGRLKKGVIKSPNYPFNYENDLNCTYSIYFPDTTFTVNRKICFQTKSFSLENSSPFCSFDYLKIGTLENSYKYCGRGIWQYGLYSSKNNFSSVWSTHLCWSIEGKGSFDITFVSDNAIVGQGFYLEYFIVNNDTSFARGNNEAPCGDEQWTCFNRECIASSEVCNGAAECMDGSDESYTHSRCLRGKNIFACDIPSDILFIGNYCGLIFRGFILENSTHRRDKFNSLKTALLVSSITGPNIRLEKQYCFSMHYTFNGHGNGMIFVSLNQNSKTPEWSKSLSRESQTDSSKWENVQLNLENVFNSKAIIEFKAEESCWFNVKDISLSEGLCPDGELSCNFASGLCGWTNVDWPNLTMLPNITLNSWSYMQEPETNHGFAKLELVTGKAMGILMSPTYGSARESNEISLKYYIRSLKESDPCYVSLYILLLNYSLSELWNGQEKQVNAWQEAQVKYTLDKQHEILVIGFGESCFVFIRNIKVNQDSIVNFPTEIPTSSTSLHVTSTDPSSHLHTTARDDDPCMTEELRCNGVVDCAGGKDEMHCSGVTNHNLPVPSTPGSTEFLGAGEISGIVIGCIMVIILMMVVTLIRMKAKKRNQSDARRSESTISILGQAFKFSSSSSKPPLPSVTDLHHINSNIMFTQNTHDENNRSNNTVGSSKPGTSNNLSTVGSESDVLEFPHITNQSRMAINRMLSTRPADHVYEEPQYITSFPLEDEVSASSSFSYVHRHDTNVKDDTISLELRSPMEMRIINSSTPHMHPNLPCSLSSISNSTTNDDLDPVGNLTPKKASIDPRLYLLERNYRHQRDTMNEKSNDILSMHATNV